MSNVTFSCSSPPRTLYFLVLLPSISTESYNFVASETRPSAQARHSGCCIQILRAFNESGPSKALVEAEEGENTETDKVVGRRLTLAPGIVAGTQARDILFQSQLGTLASSPSLVPIERPATPPSFSQPPLSAEPGLQASLCDALFHELIRNQPGTVERSAIPPLANVGGGGSSRGDLAITSNSDGVAGGNTTSKPGWKADELVGVLRCVGREVNVDRDTTRLPSFLSPQPGLSQTSSNHQSLPLQPFTPSHFTHVILVPLSDPACLSSLSLQLASGTTPSVVWFHQDLLERARKSEDKWLSSAVDIRGVADMRDQAILASTGISLIDKPVILVHSANSHLSQTTIAAAIAAGVSGVLKVPYDVRTTGLVSRMVRVAREGRVSSADGLNSAHGASLFPDKRKDPFVVLPHTALAMGAAQQAEKVLSDAIRSHGNNIFGGWDSISLFLNESTTGRRTFYTLLPRQVGKLSLRNTEQPIPAGPATSSSAQSTKTPNTAFSLTAPFTSAPRRRVSVNDPGLAIASKKAHQAVKAAPSSSGAYTKGLQETCTPPFSAVSVSSARLARDGNMEFARLLNELFCRTQLLLGIDFARCEQLSKPLGQEHRNILIDALGTWNFRPYFLDEDDLYRVACLLFEGVLETEGFAELEIERDQINRVLLALRAIYHAPNPYHNYVHAIDVLQATYTFLMDLGLVPPFEELRYAYSSLRPRWATATRSVAVGEGTKLALEVMRPQDVLALLIAAMGHDVGHPGLSNAFEKNAATPLFQVYDGHSVLENMHCMLISRLLRTHGLGFLLSSTLQSSATGHGAIDTRGFRNVLYSSVLATDISLHFAWIDEVEAFEGELREGGVRTRDTEELRIIICQALIKCADISNSTRPMDVSIHWSTVLLQEWTLQASLETALQLPVSVSLGADVVSQAKSQIGFIDMVCQELFQAVSNVLPEMHPYADACASNRQSWQSRLTQLLKQEASHIIQHDYPNAVQDPRLFTFFSLLLPASLLTVPTENLPNNLAIPPTSRSETEYGLKNSVLLEDPNNPAIEAMRAVYHTRGLNSWHRFSSWSRGTMTGELGVMRRQSTPNGVS